MNIIDYVKKYGETDYATLPFNNVDRLILSQFSYFKFDSLVPQVGEDKPSVTIGHISRMPEVDELFQDERYAKNNRALFDAMAEGSRFSLIRLNYFIDIRDEEKEIQFSAITAFLPDGETHIIYRGTDESIIGWKEDLNMAFMTPIPAQEKALDYINYVAPLIEGDFSVGGHSKGGNLAVYASMMCSSDIQSRITRIDSHDGPGFTKDVLEGIDFERIRDKVHKYVPRSSIVGMLLTTMEDYEVVSCKNFSILQHDPYNWIINDTDFAKKDQVYKHKQIQDGAINKWAESLSVDEIKELSDNLYEVFTKADIDDLNDIYLYPTQSARKLMDAIETLPENKMQAVKDVLDYLIMLMLDDAKVGFDEMREELMAGLGDAYDEMKNGFNEAYDGMKSGINEAYDEMKNGFNEMKSEFKSKFKHDSDSVD